MMGLVCRTPILMGLLWVGLAGCNKETSSTTRPDEAPIPMDAANGPATDAAIDDGEVHPDGVPPTDGAVAPVDATPMDDPDAAPVTDAGAPNADPLNTLLDAWFADFNAGRGLAYLDETGQVFPDGDPDGARLPPHRHYRDVPYGPYSRNRLDFWAPNAPAATPIAVYIHGGGFVGGERQAVQNGNTLRRLLEAGVAVATISYRWAYRDAERALDATIPNDVGEEHDINGTRLDYIMRDCARSIQYLRHRAADWNIDSARVGAWGSSAGAGCVMWAAAMPELAHPNHPDPVLRQSSRLAVAGHNNGQVTYDFLRWPELLGFEAEWTRTMVSEKAQALAQMTWDQQTESAEGQGLSRVLDYYGALSGDDPPFMTVSGAMNTGMDDIQRSGEVIHHVRGHTALYERCQALGLGCAIQTPALTEGFDGDLVGFLIAHLIAD